MSGTYCGLRQVRRASWHRYPDAVQSRAPLSDNFPGGMQSAARDLTTFATPLILARVLRVAVGIVRPEKKSRGIRRSISESGGHYKTTLLTC